MQIKQKVCKIVNKVLLILVQFQNKSSCKRFSFSLLLFFAAPSTGVRTPTVCLLCVQS